MFRYFLVCICLSAVVAGPLPNELTAGRIVNGVETTIENRPYQVSIQWERGNHFCGGSIISEDIVVTAAHCVAFKDPSELQVRLGSTYNNEGGIVVGVKATKYHEKFDGDILWYDIAIVKLDKPVKQSSVIRYIEMAKKVPKTGTPAVVSGWGTKCFSVCPLSPVLMEVEVTFLEREDCASKTYLYGDQIKETMVCGYAKEKDSCQGDSGGPFVAEGKLVGVVSWGERCALEGYPGVYADVAALRNWVLENAQKLYKFSIVPVYDIAILKISKPVYQTKTIRYIKLAKTRPRTGARAVVSGWGTTGLGLNGISVHLRKATVRYIDGKDCASFGRNIYRVFITETMICAETLDQAACAGDSGSPLVVKGELVGIASWGAGCGTQNFPDVYTDVVALRYWINNALKTLIKRESSEKQKKQTVTKYNTNSENRNE
uniref:Peptidase S1 domain-containing protein n=1 Tax=Glossina pallidipes TaxID=7398 RepID=A0A1B0AAJ1_GLOPL